MNILRKYNINYKRYFKRLFNSKSYIGKTGAEVIKDILVEKNVKHVWGFTGGAALPLTDQFHPKNNSSIIHIMGRNEQGLGHSAEGYSKSLGKKTPGIIVTTSGPGVTNLITPIQDAYADGVPLIIFTGQVASSTLGTGAFQECPAIELTKPCTKWSKQVLDVNKLQCIVNQAFDIAMSGRKGPVHIDLPKDVLMNTVSKESDKRIYCKVKNGIRNPSKDYENKIHNLIKLINISERPVLFVGQGANDDFKLVREFVEKSNIPVTTTLHGMGIYDESKSNSLKMVGMHGSVYANYAIQDSDLIIGLGARFDDRTIGNPTSYAPKARQAALENKGGIVHVNICENQIGKTIEPTLSIVSECKNLLEDIIPHIKYKERKEWFQKINKWKKDYPFSYDNTQKLSMQDVLKEVDKQTYIMDNVIFSTGVGNHQMMAAQYITWKNPNTILSSGSLGTMGVGLPFAIGAKMANPNSTVINIDGDGSFNMTLTELGTANEYNIPVKILLLNNERQQMVHVWQRLFFNGNLIATDNVNPNYNDIANAYNFEYSYCDNKETLYSSIRNLISTNRPIIAEFKVNPDMCTPLVSPGKSLDDMIFSINEFQKDETSELPS